MATVVGELGTKLCEDLGLDPKIVSKLVITFDAQESNVWVDITTRPDGLLGLRTELKSYVLNQYDGTIDHVCLNGVTIEPGGTDEEPAPPPDVRRPIEDGD